MYQIIYKENANKFDFFAFIRFRASMQVSEKSVIFVENDYLLWERK